MLGNIGHRHAGLKLYLAVQEAVAWIGEPISPGTHSLEDAIRRASDPEQLSGTQKALNWAANRHRLEQCPRPSRRSERAFIEVQLFTILRFAFLHDNEMLPASLREVQNPVTTEKKTVKTAVGAQEVIRRPYSFNELWEAHERQRLARIDNLPDSAGRSDLNALFTPDNVLRTKADEVRKTSARKLPRRVRKALIEFRAEIVAGYTSR